MKKLLFALLLSCVVASLHAQELNAKVSINRTQVSNTKSGVFDALQDKVTRLLNEHAWTDLKYRDFERIQCTFNITIDTYSETDNSFTGSMIVAVSRPVFNSSYTTTVFSMTDKDVTFTFQEFDQLEWRPEQVDNNLTAMFAYWAYLLIGMDLDAMSQMGGTKVLQMAQDVCNNAEMLGFKGWKAFDDTKNRYAIINDYLDGSMEPFRQLQYIYHRTGLDHMAEDVESARTAIIEAVRLLKEAHENKSLSMLPQIFSDYKRDELVSIFSGQGSTKEREEIYDILFRINPSQNNYWEKIKQ